MRLFVAINLPADVKEKISGALEPLAAAVQREQAAVRWVKPEQLHFTLKFLGECLQTQVPSLIKELEKAVVETKPFSMALGMPENFPERGKPQIIWVKPSEGTAEIVELAARVEAACEKLGFARDKRVFTPHMTLGRVTSVRFPDKLRQIVHQTGFPADGTLPVDAVGLIRSILAPAGPTYTMLKTIGF